MRAKTRKLPVLLIVANLIGLTLIIFRSEILREKLFGKEVFFVFSMMATLVQPIPVLVGAFLSRIYLFEKILVHPFGLILYLGISGCVQWYLIGLALSNLTRSIKISAFERLSTITLSLLILAFLTYILSLALDFDSLRTFSEQFLVILWIATAFFLLIHLVKWMLSVTKNLARKSEESVPGSKVTRNEMTNGKKTQDLE